VVDGRGKRHVSALRLQVFTPARYLVDADVFLSLRHHILAQQSPKTPPVPDLAYRVVTAFA
jgi:hypothetical protein